MKSMGLGAPETISFHVLNVSQFLEGYFVDVDRGSRDFPEINALPNIGPSGQQIRGLHAVAIYQVSGMMSVESC